jgi:hypothetical protein
MEIIEKRRRRDKEEEKSSYIILKEMVVCHPFLTLTHTTRIVKVHFNGLASGWVSEGD